MLGEDAGSCLRIVSSKNGNRYNCALMGYVLQSHVRALVVFDTARRVLARSLIRLLLRSDTLTPVIFCDPIFFTTDYSEELQLDVLKQARLLEGSASPVAPRFTLCTPPTLLPRAPPLHPLQRLHCTSSTPSMSMYPLPTVCTRPLCTPLCTRPLHAPLHALCTRPLHALCRRPLYALCTPPLHALCRRARSSYGCRCPSCTHARCYPS